MYWSTKYNICSVELSVFSDADSSNSSSSGPEGRAGMSQEILARTVFLPLSMHK